jgi:hypothetical protein
VDDAATAAVPARSSLDGHLSVRAISDATPPQTRDSHPSPWMRSTHITVSPAVPTKGLP